MATLSTTRNYADGEVLVRADLDAFLDDIESFLNITKINDDNIQDSGITGSTKLLNQSVTAGKLASDSVTTLKILDANVTTAKLADSAVTTAKIADANVTAAELASDSVITVKILDANVTTAKIADSGVTTAKILDANVTTAKLADSAVTTVKIADGNVTPTKFATTYLSSTLNNLQNGAGTSYARTASFQAYGRPVEILIWGGTLSLTAGTASTNTAILNRFDGVSTHTALLTLASNTGSLTLTYGTQGNDANGTIFVYYLDTPAAGTYYYEIENAVTSSGASHTSNLKILVREI